MVKVALSRFQMCLDPVPMFLVEGTSKTVFYRHLSNRFFPRRQFGKHIGYEDHLLFENVQNLMSISKMQRKIEKKYFVSEIIISDLVALNCLY